MIRDIQGFFGSYDLRRKARLLNRRKTIHNFSTARTAGVLFTCKSEEEFNAIKEFKEFLESHNIKVEILGFVNDREVPDYYLLRTGFNFFCLRDLNWFQRPNRPFALEFSTREFDLLFDLSLEDYFPLKYLTRLSPASYKIGLYRATDDHDLMIELQDQKTLPYLVEQVRHYLSLIHSKNS